MADTPVLNVATIENHPQRHIVIFESWDHLKVGGSFIIRNDHDPLPVYFQLKSRSGDIVHWEYLKKGPDLWDIKVTKTEEGADNPDPLI